MKLVFKLIGLIELVLSLLKFCDIFIEFGSGENRCKRVCSRRDVCYRRVDFLSGTVSL